MGKSKKDKTNMKSIDDDFLERLFAKRKLNKKEAVIGKDKAGGVDCKNKKGCRFTRKQK